VNREQFAWALVGWFNLLALIIVGIVIAHLSGHTVVLTGWLILGLALITLVVVIALLWLIMRRS
jgi:hypothetical protein